MSSIKLEHINKKFNDVVLLNNINYEFFSSNVYIIKAPSGSGKTTLLTILSNLEKPSSGKVVLNGFPQISNPFSYLFTDYQLFFELTGIENLLLVSKDKDKIYSFAKRLKIDLLLNKKVSTYSKGEAQRLGIIRIIMENKPILILDEPTGNLDEKNTQIVYDLLNEISTNKIIIIVTHDNTKQNLNTLCIEKKTLIEKNHVEINHDNYAMTEQVKKLKLPFSYLIKFIKNLFFKDKIKTILVFLLMIIVTFISAISCSFIDSNKNIASILEKNNVSYIYSDKDYSFSYQNIEYKNTNCLYSKDNSFNIDGKKYTLNDNEVLVSSNNDFFDEKIKTVGKSPIDFNLISNNLIKEDFSNSNFFLNKGDIKELDNFLSDNAISTMKYKFMQDKSQEISENQVILYCSQTNYDVLYSKFLKIKNKDLKFNNSIFSKYSNTLEFTKIKVDKSVMDYEIKIGVNSKLWQKYSDDYYSLYPRIFNNAYPYIVFNENFNNIDYKKITTEESSINSEINFYNSIDNVKNYFLIFTLVLYIVLSVSIIFLIDSINRNFRYQKLLLKILDFKKSTVVFIYFIMLFAIYVCSTVISTILFLITNSAINKYILKFLCFDLNKNAIYNSVNYIAIIYLIVIFLISLKYSKNNKNFVEAIKVNRE